jgi:hypothetical protein
MTEAVPLLRTKNATVEKIPHVGGAVATSCSKTRQRSRSISLLKNKFMISLIVPILPVSKPGGDFTMMENVLFSYKKVIKMESGKKVKDASRSNSFAVC